MKTRKRKNQNGGEETRKSNPGEGRLQKFLYRYEIPILFLLIFFVYNTVTQMAWSGDVIPAVYLPVSLIVYQSVNFDALASLIGISHPNLAYAFPLVNGHYVSIFPIVTPVLATPLYFLFCIPLIILGIGLDQTIIFLMAKSSAAAIASLSCVIVYLTAKELFSKTTALATVFIYAFGTSTWSVSSQTLWQHGTTELLLISLLYLIIQNERRPSRNLIVGIGLLSGLFVFNRPPDVFLLLPVIGYIVWYERKKLPVFAISTAVTGLPFLAYNLLTFGNVFGGYGYGGLTKLYAFSPSFVVAFAGSLVSPKVGLLVFCPVLILSVFGYLNLKSVREDRIRQVLVLFGPAIFLLVLEYSFFVQWESAVVWSYGQRYLTGCIPILAIYTGFFLDDIIRRDQHDSWMRAIQTGIILLVMISVGIQAIGVFLSPFHPDRSSLSEETWDWGNSIVLKSYTYGISNVSSVTMYNFPPLPPVFEYKFPRAAAGNANNTYPG